MYDIFDTAYRETIEDSYRTSLTLKDQHYDLTIIDTSGNHQFPAMRNLAIQKSHAFVLVYALNSLKSFHEMKRLHGIIRKNQNKRNHPTLFVGNMFDQPIREITLSDVKELLFTGDSETVQHIEVSAKTDFNIKFLFRKIVHMIMTFQNSKEQGNMNIKYNLVNNSRFHHSPRITRALTLGPCQLPSQNLRRFHKRELQRETSKSFSM